MMKIVGRHKGQSLVEFSLILPLLLMVTIGIMEFGRILVSYSEVTNASREAARYGASTGFGSGGTARYLDCTGIRNAARTRTTLVGLDNSDIAISYDRDNGSNGMGVFANCGEAGLSTKSIVLGDRVVVEVTTTIEPILNFLPLPSFNLTVPTARTILKDLAIGQVECQDGVDNDGDGAVDYPDDDGCASPDDTIEAICYRLEVLAIPSDAGVVSFSPTTNCANRLIEQTVVSFEAIPDAERDLYTFDYWGGDAAGTDPTTSVTMDTDKSVTANFRRWQADLGITKSDITDPVFVGETIDYTLSINNAGPDRATGVIITDTLPAGVTFVSASPTQGTCSESGGEVHCELGEIAAASTAQVSIRVLAPMLPGSISNTAIITGSVREVDTNPANNIASETTTVDPLADVYVTKSASPSPSLYAAEQLIYTIPFGNNGPSQASNVQVVDILPAGVTLVSASWSGGACLFAADLSGITGGKVTCDIGAVPSGASDIIEIIVQAPDDGGTISNQASISAIEADPDLSNNTSNIVETTVIAWSDLAIDKVDNPDPTYRDDTLTYEITLQNNGPSLATGVQIKDQLPPDIILLGYNSPDGICSLSSGTMTCNIGNLAAGASATVIIKIEPTKKGTIYNKVWWESINPITDLVPENDEDIEATVVDSSANLALVKTDVSDPVMVRDTLIYELTIINRGPSHASSVTLVDNLPSSVEYTSNSGTWPGGSCQATDKSELTCNIGKLDKGESIVVTIVVTPTTAGEIHNVASVTGAETDPNPGNNQDDEYTTIEGYPAISLIPSCGSAGDLITVEGTYFPDGPYDLDIYFHYGDAGSAESVHLLDMDDYVTNGGSWSETVVVPGEPVEGTHQISVSYGSVLLYAKFDVPCPIVVPLKGGQ